MNTRLRAENYIRKWFRDNKGIALLPVTKKEKEAGFDFRNTDSTLFVEVKGTTQCLTKTEGLKKKPFFTFTDAEYKKAESCLQDGLKYEIHIVACIDTEKQCHYVIPAEVLMAEAKPAAFWNLPIKANYKNYIVELS